MDPALRNLAAAAGAAEVEAVVRLTPGAEPPPGVRLVARFGDIATCRLPRTAIAEVWADDAVASLKAARPFGLDPEPIAREGDAGDGSDTEAGPTDERRPEGLPETGRGVVVCIVDWGLDCAHPNFRNGDGSTRLLALWDQSAPGPGPEPYRYGRVYSRQEIDRALRTDDPYTALGYHPAAGDPGGRGAHGTHVADIAAGNGRAEGSPSGVAPEADLLFVHLATRGTGGQASLGDSVTLLEALDWICGQAGDRPWVVNLSVGRHGGPHNGLTPVEQAIDALLGERPGRAVIQSTGNYHLAQAHASGTLRPGESRTLGWWTDAADLTPNELEVWYPGRDRFGLEVRPPWGGREISVPLGEEATLTHRGREVGRIYHRAHDPAAGDHHIDLFLDPRAPAGRWEITLTGEDVADGRYHAWVERDVGCPDCQSRLDPEDADPLTTHGTLASTFRSIAVGAYDGHQPDLVLAPFSSAGPTRDGRIKPDLVAPGVDVLAARSASRELGSDTPLLTRHSGTSMAAPCVTGTVALMFEAAGRPLAIGETRRLLLGTALPVELAGDDGLRVGSGVLAIEAAVAAARELANHSQPTTESVMFRDDSKAGCGCGCSAAPQAVEVEEGTELLDEGFEAEVGAGPFASEWLEVVDEAIARGESEPLSVVAAEMGLREASGGRLAPSPARLFDAVALGAVEPGFEALFEVVALPGEPPATPPAPGDLLLIRAWGEGDLAHVAMLAGEVDEEPPSGGPPAPPARSAPVRETRGNGSRPVLDGRGRALPDRLVLRPRLAPAGGAGRAPAGTRLVRRGAPVVAQATPPAPVATPPAAPQTAAQPDTTTPCPTPPTLLDNFATGQSALTPALKTRIRQVAQEVADSQETARPVHSVCLVGHTDSKGDDAFNLDLGRQRAQSVDRELRLRIDGARSGLAARLTFQPPDTRGESSPVGDNSTEAGRAQNRRVEVFLNRQWRTACHNPPVSADDPAGLATHPVGERDLPTGATPIEVELRGPGGPIGVRLPLRVSIFYPADRDGRNAPFRRTLRQVPVVFMLHGNHFTTRNRADRTVECCPEFGCPDQEAIPNHKGFAYLQRALARAGIVSVSVDCNDLHCGAGDTAATNHPAIAGAGPSATNIHHRAALLLEAVRHMLGLHRGTDGFFGNRLDFSRVAFFGHSRGGEAVLVAAEAVPTRTDLGGVTVVGVYSLAPTDNRASSGSPNGFAFATMLPAADGDVVENDGAKYYDRATPSPFKCQLYVHGANHNFFNSEWPNSDCDRAELGRPEHEAILAAYASAFLRRVLLNHDTLRFLRADELPPGVRADRVHISFEQSGVVTIDDHENRNISLNSLNQATTQASGLTAAEFDFRQGSVAAFNASFFGSTVGMVARTTNRRGLFRSQLDTPRDFTGRELWVRGAEVFDGAAVPARATGFVLGLEDAVGRRAFADSDQAGGGLPSPYDRTLAPCCTPDRPVCCGAALAADCDATSTKTMLKTLRFPIGCFAGLGFDPTRVQAVLLRLDRGDGRALAFDQLQIV